MVEHIVSGGVPGKKARPESPPNSWSHLGCDPTPEEVAAADAAHDAWMASPAGVAFRAWDEEVVAQANRTGTSYREAMDALGYAD